jgi:hypothetical protein
MILQFHQSLHILFPVGCCCCLLDGGVTTGFDCFFLASPLCTSSRFSFRPDACCCFADDGLIPLVETAGLLFSSVAATFFPAGALFDVVG